MTTRIDIIAIIANFIRPLAPSADLSAIGDDTDLMTLIDSYSFLDLLLHLGEETGTVLDFSDGDPVQFVRVGTLIEAVLSSLKRTGA